MPFATAQDIINKVFNVLLITAAETGDAPTAAQSNGALLSINMMLDEWAAEKLISVDAVRQSFVLTANKYAYTFGAGGDFNQTMPIEVKSGFYRDSSNEGYPVDIYSREQYDSIPDAIVSNGPPKGIFFDEGATQQTGFKGTLYVYPVPDASSVYTLFLDNQIEFTELAALNTAYNFRNYYQQAIVYNAALRIAPEYGAIITEEIKMIAQKSLDVIRSVNSKRIVSAIDCPSSDSRSGKTDIYSVDGWTN